MYKIHELALKMKLNISTTVLTLPVPMDFVPIIVAKRYIKVQQKCLNKWIEGKNTISQLSTPYTEPEHPIYAA